MVSDLDTPGPNFRSLSNRQDYYRNLPQSLVENSQEGWSMALTALLLTKIRLILLKNEILMLCLQFDLL